ncbi:MAG TPA: methyltransferase domain-containing protein [Marmoricola sp.]|nr:methyltransferase domain-containing protein [Marmoricola sp.]
MSDVGAAYDASGAVWHTGPSRVYEPLAVALLDRAPVDLAGRRVLDVGAGTGIASRVALRAGAALVVAADLAPGMLRLRDPTVRAVVADAQALPFAEASLDLVVAAFSLGHLPDPARGLREARRVAPALAASAFDPSWGHPAKAAVDEVMGEFGFRTPDWYVELKSHESDVEDPDALADLARRAGYDEVEVARVDVETGVATPEAMVDWRWGMAHLAPFVASLGPERRREAREAAEAAVEGQPPVVVPMLALSAQAASSSRRE